MAAESLTIQCLFHLTLDTGELSVDYKGLRFGPKTRVADLDEAVATKAASFPNTDSAYVIGSVRLPDGRWFYINLGFSRDMITAAGVSLIKMSRLGGGVQASYDSRTELPGIAIRFH